MVAALRQAVMSERFRSTVHADIFLPNLIPLTAEGACPRLGFAIRRDLKNSVLPTDGNADPRMPELDACV